MVEPKKFSELKGKSIGLLANLGVPIDELADEHEVDKSIVHDFVNQPEIHNYVQGVSKIPDYDVKQPFERGIEFILSEDKISEVNKELIARFVPQTHKRTREIIGIAQNEGDTYMSFIHGVVGDNTINQSSFELFKEYIGSVSQPNRSTIDKDFEHEILRRTVRGDFFVSNSSLKQVLLDHLIDETLNDHQKDIVTRFYGLNTDKRSLEYLGKEYNIVPARVQNIKEQGLRTIRAGTKSHSLAYMVGHSDTEVRSFINKHGLYRPLKNPTAD